MLLPLQIHSYCSYCKYDLIVELMDAELDLLTSEWSEIVYGTLKFKTYALFYL